MVSGKVLARYGLKPRRNEKMSHPTKSQLLDAIADLSVSDKASEVLENLEDNDITEREDAIDELEAIDFESAYPQEEEERE